jgi:hypothetical protein
VDRKFSQRLQIEPPLNNDWTALDQDLTVIAAGSNLPELDRRHLPQPVPLR